MARPYWSGQLKLSLVSFGIEMYPATAPANEISFHQLDRKTGRRVHHQNTVEKGGAIDRADIVKGYEYSKGKYLVVEPEEIAHLRIESRDTLELAQFVDVAEISPALFEKPYFLLPDGDAQPDAFAVIRNALVETGKAGLGEIVFGGREHLVAVMPPADKTQRGMMAYVLRYEEELKNADDFFANIPDVKIDKRQLGMAVQLIEQYSSPLNLSNYKDDYETALRQLVEAKRANKPLPLDKEEPRTERKLFLMDALRRSLEPTRTKTAAASKKSPGPKKPAASERGTKRKARAA